MKNYFDRVSAIKCDIRIVCIHYVSEWYILSVSVREWCVCMRIYADNRNHEIGH